MSSTRGLNLAYACFLKCLIRCCLPSFLELVREVGHVTSSSFMYSMSSMALQHSLRYNAYAWFPVICVNVCPVQCLIWISICNFFMDTLCCMIIRSAISCCFCTIALRFSWEMLLIFQLWTRCTCGLLRATTDVPNCHLKWGLRYSSHLNTF